MATKTLERLRVLLTADDSDLRGKLGKASKPIEGFHSKIRGIAKVAAPVAGAVTAIGTAAVGAALKAGRMADELLDLSEQTGLTTDQLQEYRRVTNQAGVDTDTIARAAEQMTLRFSRGAEGSADLRQGLEQLGISAKDAEGNMRPMSEIVDEAIVGLAGMEDATERNVLATKLFSRGASDLAPVLGLGADEIQRLRDEAHDLGLVIGKDSLEDANRFRQSWDGVKQELQGVVTQVGVDLIPSMQGLADNIQGSWRPAIEGVANSFVFVVESAVGFTNNLQRIWVGIQGIILNAVTGIVNAVGNLLDAIPILGERIAVARDQFAAWSNQEMLQLKERMDELNASTSATTEAVRESTAAAGRNATAVTNQAQAVGQAAQFEEVALLNLQNTIQGTSQVFRELEEVAVGASSNINVKASTAFQQMADAVSTHALSALTAVQRVLAKLSGGGGFLGGIGGAISGFLSGGPIGGGLGFLGGIGLFAEGGTIRAGDIGIVGERGPEIVTGPATVTPMQMQPSGPSDAQVRALIDAAPRGQTPSEAALSAWWRQVFSELYLDGKARGVVP